MTFATENVHRYPRWLRFSIEIICAVLALIVLFNWFQTMVQFIWDRTGRSLPEALRNPTLIRFMQWIDGSATGRARLDIADLFPAFFWLAVTMALILYLRNLFPTIRTSGRGMLVEWGSTWMPVSWEQIKSVQVTEDLSGARFVVLVQTNTKGLSGWHRVYSFLYRFGFRRGVLITSAISDFMPLVQTMLRELEQEARQTGHAPIVLDEKTRSPFFQLVLSPMGFFSPRSKADKDYVDQATIEARSAQPGRVTRLMATYPNRVSTPLTIIAGVLALFGFWRAFALFARWLSTQFPGTRRIGIFDLAAYPAGTSLWWVPLAAILLVVVLIPMLIVLRNMLPDVESRPEGLAVRFFTRWLLIPWNQITAVKTVEINDDLRTVLIQSTDRTLTPWHKAYSMLFEGSTERGVILTSALSTFDALMQQIVLEVSRGQRHVEREDGLLNEDAPAWPMRLTFKAGETLDRLVSHYDQDAESAKFNYPRLIEASRPMLWIAGLYTAILLVSQLINNVLPPAPQLIITAVFFFIFCLLEWLLTAGLAKALEQNSDVDAHRNRPLYIYPIVQSPRILPLLGGLILVLLGLPWLAALVWIGTAFWSFLLTAGLWDSMYGWDSTKFFVMGAVPAVYQLIMMLVWLALI